MPKITPFLWYNNQAEEAARFYTSVFKNSRIIEVQHFEGPDPAGKVTVVEFEIDGQRVTAMNGGPDFKLDEAFSFYVECASQDEVDYYWEALTADGGQESQCGWLKDKYGLSWQIVPELLMKMMKDPDKEKASRAMQAMLKMQKIETSELQKAVNQK